MTSSQLHDPPGDSAGKSADVVEGTSQSLDPRYVSMRQMVGGLVTVWVGVVSAAGGLAIWLVADGTTAAAIVLASAWIVLVGGLGWRSRAWPRLQYRHASYTVDDDGIEIRTGVLWRKMVNVPRSRIQHTDVSQGPIMRMYGLGKLDLFTAGTRFADVKLPGLSRETALAIRDHLLPDDGDDGA